jgi:hypothetical protein
MEREYGGDGGGEMTAVRKHVTYETVERGEGRYTS